MENNTPQTLEKTSFEHDAMRQIDEVLEKVYCENPSYIKVLIKALVNAEGKMSLNGKWEIKTIYLPGSEVRKFYQDEKVIRYILSQILRKPFKLSFKDRHNLQLIVLR